MKRILLIFSIMLLMMSSLAFAGIEVLSTSQIDFYKTDSELGSEAFKMLVIENGGSEKILFNDMKPTGDYELEKSSGYISGQPSGVYIDYPFNTRSYNGELWHITKLNGGTSKYFWFFSDAQDWCTELSQTQAFVPNSLQAFAGKDGNYISGTGNYFCYAPEKLGFIADVGGYQYQWTETFSIWNPIEGDFQTITLNNQDKEGVFEYSPNKNIVAKYSFSGLNLNSYIPDLSSKYSVFQSDSFNKIIERLDSTEVNQYQSSNIMTQFLKDYMGANAYQDVIVEGGSSNLVKIDQDPEFLRNQIDGELTDLTRTKYVSESGWTSTLDTSNGNIKLTRTDTDFPISPVFTLKIDAEWVGLFQPTGKPVLESFEVVEEEYVEGDYNAKYKSVVSNEGEDSSFSYQMACNPNTVTIDAISTQFFPSGDERVLYHNIRADTTGDNIRSNCCLVVTDRNDPTIKSEQICDVVTFVERNQCPTGMEAGDQSCSLTGGIMQCQENEDGLLILKSTAVNCENGCAINGFKASCNPAPGCEDKYTSLTSSSDGMCEDFEMVGEKCESWEDCSTTGDGYCSAKEKELGTDPSACDGGSGSTSSSTLAYAVFGGLSGLAIFGALALRLKKDGYFEK